MANTKTKEQNVAVELEWAQRNAEDVLQRIRAGDEKVGPEDLEAAERHVWFVRARLEGEERLQRLQELEERAIKELDPNPVRKAREEAEKAHSAYVKACVEYNARLAEIVSELPALEPLPEGWAVEDTSAGANLTAGGHHARRIRPMVEVSRIAHEQLRKHIPRGYIDLEQPY